MGEAPLPQIVAAARAAWPGLALDEATFAAHVERHLAAQGDRDAAAARLRADELFLACACARAVPGAIEAFERRYAPVIEGVVARFARAPERRAELRQLLRDRLFVAAPGGEPRIATYAGQGFLENWVRVAAVRAFSNDERARRGTPPSDDDGTDAIADLRDVELDFLKAHYRDAFRAAFRRALSTLAASDRLLLRLSVVDGLGCDEIAAALGVHRATAARRTARAKQQIVEATREELARALRVDTIELASILRLVESHLDVSLSRLLGRIDAGGQGV